MVRRDAALDAYADLLKRAVLGVLDLDETRWALTHPDTGAVLDNAQLATVLQEGVWALQGAHTLLGWKRLTNVQDALDLVCDERIPGDVIEAGIWRGGTVAFMRGYLNVRGEVERRVVGADSFQGLPPARELPDLATVVKAREALIVGRDTVEAMLRRYGLRDGVELVEGWFAETLSTLKDRTWAVVRIDADLYASTRDALTALYPTLAPGGVLILDDYGTWKPCRTAVDEYRALHGITTPLREVDFTGRWWRKEG
jgi:hypothetical protein